MTNRCNARVSNNGIGWSQKLSEPLPLNTTKWTVNSDIPLVSCQWGTAHFIFHRESGQTHFVNQSCIDILSLVTQESLTVEEIYRGMLARHAIDDDPDLSEAIERVVGLLDQLGVISSLP